MLVKVFGSAISGITATTVCVEVSVEQGVGFFLVGLPDNAVKESYQRVSSALQCFGYKIPGKKIIINMAPADIRKEGSAYDLPIAMGILAASEQIIADSLSDYLIMGELSLDGSLQPIKGALPIALEAKAQGFKGFILPKANAPEAAIVKGLEVYGIESILEVINFILFST
jgi:magnesium chelatase family protein